MTRTVVRDGIPWLTRGQMLGKEPIPKSRITVLGDEGHSDEPKIVLDNKGTKP